MKHIKNIARIIGLQLVDLVVILLGLIIVPIALFFRRDAEPGELLHDEYYPNQVLPMWANWYNNWDDGLWGDAGWRNEHRPNDYDTYLAMFLWAAIRNPAFEFGIKLGINGIVKEKRIWGKHFKYNSSYPQDSIYDEIRVDNYLNAQGMAYRELDMEDGRTLAQYSFCKAYPFRIKGKSYGFRLQIGPFIQAVQPDEIGTNPRLGHSVLIQPFKEFK